MMTIKRLNETHGVTPQQWRRMKIIGGCSGDNVPGCFPKVGEGRALKCVKGELRSAWRTKINSEVGILGQTRNYKLVSLPMGNLAAPTWKDCAFSMKGLREVLRMYGLKRMLTQSDSWEMVFGKGIK